MADENNNLVQFNKLIVSLDWEPNVTNKLDFDLDLSAFMLNNDRKLPSDDFHVFFNNLKSPDSALVMSGDDKTGKRQNEEGNEVIHIDLSKVDEKVEEIVFTATINDFYLGLNFGNIMNSCIRIKDEITGELIVNYELHEDFSDENAVEFVKLVRGQDKNWKFDVIGQGYKGSLQFFGGKYGYKNGRILMKIELSSKKEHILDMLGQTDNNDIPSTYPAEKHPKINPKDDDKTVRLNNQSTQTKKTVRPKKRSQPQQPIQSKTRTQSQNPIQSKSNIQIPKNINAGSEKVMLIRSRWSIAITLALIVLFNYLIFSSNQISIFLHIVVFILYIPFLLLTGLYLFSYKKEIVSIKEFFDDPGIDDDDLDTFVEFILAYGLPLSIIILPIISFNLLLLALSIPISIILSRLLLKRLLLKNKIFILLIPLISLVSFLSTFYLSDLKYSYNTTEMSMVINKKSPKQLAVLKTLGVIDISQTEATLKGLISSTDRTKITEKGFCWSTTPNPTVDDNKITALTDSLSFQSRIEGLSKSTTYYVRSFASSNNRTSYGNEVYFMTFSNGFPVVSTLKVKTVTSSTAVIEGMINSESGFPVNAKGFCWNTKGDPSVDDIKIKIAGRDNNFKTKITGLRQITTYYIRAYATNDYGTGYGKEISFTTLGTVRDIDGNLYHAIRIGSQTWLKENLEVTRYNNGNLIKVRYLKKRYKNTEGVESKYM
jgi:tellurium resistance protein TerD